MTVLPESESLTDEERNFRLKGRTSAGRRWNQNFEREVTEYLSGIEENDPGFASSKAADIRKRYNGMQRKIQNLSRTAVVCERSERLGH